MENELPDGWKVVSLSSIITELESGSRPKGGVKGILKGVPSIGAEFLSENGHFKPNKVRYVPESFYKGIKRGIVKKGDVLIVKDGATTGKVSFVDNHFPYDTAAVNEHVFRLRVDEQKCLQKFLFYYLFSKQGNTDLMKNFKGTAQGGINSQFVNNLNIALPTLSIQKTIVKKLNLFFEEYETLKDEKQKAKRNHEKLLQSAIGKLIELNDFEFKPIEEVFDVNPSKKEIEDIDDDAEVSFIPMNAVSDKEGIILKRHTKTIGRVRKGYTYFKDGDVIFAKITPCMENGKIAIANNLKNGIGFGSTEFHVFRSKGEVLPEFLYFYLRQKSFRLEARMNMTGTAGQLRVPTNFIKEHRFPVTKPEVQGKIINILEKVRDGKIRIGEEQGKIEFQLNLLSNSVITKAFQMS